MNWLKKLILILVAIVPAGAVVFFTFGPAITEKGRNYVKAHDPYPVSEAAKRLHESLLIADWHIDSLLWKRDLTKRSDRGQSDIPRMLDGNVAVQVYAAVTKSPKGQNYEHNSPDTLDNITLLAMGQLWPPRTWQSLLQRALYQAEKLHGFEEEIPNTLKVIKSSEDLNDVLQQRKNGKKVIGALLGIEGAHPLEGKLENLQVLTEAGYRLIALQHFFDNELGGTLHSTQNNGLTEFGRRIVMAVAEQNLILDVAHSSEQVVRDVLEITNIPLVVSHTGIHSHCNSKRNISDSLMKEIAGRGGVVGIGFWADVTCDDSPAGVAAAIKAAIEIVGEDHVSLGSDYDGSVTVAFDVSELAALTQALIDTGLSELQIRKVMGENMIRVLKARLG